MVICRAIHVHVFTIFRYTKIGSSQFLQNQQFHITFLLAIIKDSQRYGNF